eukprot:4639992-Amphidinium_carterae.1
MEATENSSAFFKADGSAGIGAVASGRVHGWPGTFLCKVGEPWLAQDARKLALEVLLSFIEARPKTGAKAACSTYVASPGPRRSTLHAHRLVSCPSSLIRTSLGEWMSAIMLVRIVVRWCHDIVWGLTEACLDWFCISLPMEEWGQQEATQQDDDGVDDEEEFVKVGGE